MNAHKQILIVEDDEPLAHLIKLKLESDGEFAAHVETRGTAAMNYASEHPLDLVILDLKLPDVSGYEVAKHLRKLYHPWVLPVLMLTGLDTSLDQLRGFAFGADAYLTKPYEPSELMRTIRLLLGEAAENTG